MRKQESQRYEEHYKCEDSSNVKENLDDAVPPVGKKKGPEIFSVSLKGWVGFNTSKFLQTL